jgi:hypothetical protein
MTAFLEILSSVGNARQFEERRRGKTEETESVRRHFSGTPAVERSTLPWRPNQQNYKMTAQ